MADDKVVGATVADQSLPLDWLDNSKRDLLNLCPRKFYYRHELGMVPKGSGGLEDHANAMQYGIALHEALSSLYDGSGLDLVTCPCPTMDGCEFCHGGQIPRIAALFLLHYPANPGEESKDPRTRARGIEIIHAYLEKYRREHFEVIGVELPFEIPFYEKCINCGSAGTIRGGEPCEMCEGTGKRLIFKYTGRIDLLVREGKHLSPWDHKSTSRFGEMFQSQFRLSGALTGYMRSTSVITGEPCVEGTINAIRITTRITPEDSFMRLTTTRAPEEFDEWEVEVRESYERIQTYRIKKFWPKSAPFACSAYNRICEYYMLCTAGGADTHANILASHYEVRPWDPTK